MLFFVNVVSRNYPDLPFCFRIRIVFAVSSVIEAYRISWRKRFSQSTIMQKALKQEKYPLRNLCSKSGYYTVRVLRKNNLMACKIYSQDILGNQRESSQGILGNQRESSQGILGNQRESSQGILGNQWRSSESFYRRFNDTKTPAMHIPVKMMKAMRMTRIRISRGASAKDASCM